MTDNLIVLEDLKEHIFSEVICLKCLERWLAVRPGNVLLKNLECKNGHIGYVIETGENIDRTAGEQNIDIDSLIELYEKKIDQKELSIILFNNLNDKTGKIKANYAIALYEEFIDNLRKIERCS